MLQVTSYLVKNIPKYRDGTIKFESAPYNTSVVTYDIHHYKQRHSILVGKWTTDREHDDVDFNDVVGDVKTRRSFHLDDVVMVLGNGSVVPTQAYCSVR